jgi:hypothetical protein
MVEIRKNVPSLAQTPARVVVAICQTAIIMVDQIMQLDAPSRRCKQDGSGSELL